MEAAAQWPETRGLRILGLTYGLGSNNGPLIHNPVHFEQGEIYSQITNWEKLDPIDYEPGLDSYCHFLDDPALPFEITFDETELFVQGDLSRLERQGKDKRWALLGNIGIWFRYALTTQERHGIYSLHASSIYKPQDDELLIVVGKAGAGKTVFLLESLTRGYQIFSTELTFFRLRPEGVTFYRGALMDNIRVGSFLYDFPDAAQHLGLRLPDVEDPWDHKISVSMHAVTTASASLFNPILSIVFPRIEKGYDHAIVRDITNPRTLTRLLFESASEKIGSTFLMYEELPAVGVDTPSLAAARWETMSTLVTAPQWHIKQARTTMAGPHSCMEIIDE